MGITFALASRTEADLLADIRVDAMRESLEALGRFDPERARDRFLDSFDPSVTNKIMRGPTTVGFFVLKSYEDHLHLDHLYLANSEQGRGVGRAVIDYVKSCAQERNLPVRLCALQKSRANAFYTNQGFKVTNADDLDVYYEYEPVK